MKAQASPGLYCELRWGTELSGAWTFGPEVDQVLAAADERAPLPLYGFTLPEEPFLLAERFQDRLRIHVPPAAHVERRGSGTPEWTREEGSLSAGGRRTVELSGSSCVRLVEGELQLWLQPSLARFRVAKLGVRELLWIAALIFVFISAPLGIYAMWPNPARQAESNARALSIARAKAEAERRKAGAEGSLKPYVRPVQPDGGTIPLPLRVR